MNHAIYSTQSFETINSDWT